MEQTVTIHLSDLPDVFYIQSVSLPAERLRTNRISVPLRPNMNVL